MGSAGWLRRRIAAPQFFLRTRFGLQEITTLAQLEMSLRFAVPGPGPEPAEGLVRRIAQLVHDNEGHEENLRVGRIRRHLLRLTRLRKKYIPAAQRRANGKLGRRFRTPDYNRQENPVPAKLDMPKDLHSRAAKCNRPHPAAISRTRFRCGRRGKPNGPDAAFVPHQVAPNA
jgi:hypothetical protein